MISVSTLSYFHNDLIPGWLNKKVVWLTVYDFDAAATDMSVFDALRHLSSYLYDAHTSGKHHLADLYELVQYCGNIVPRVSDS